MQETGNKATDKDHRKVTIRIGKGTLSFSTTDETALHKVVYEPYEVNRSISMAANMREAFKTSPLLQDPFSLAVTLVDTPVLLVPINEFEESEMQTLYHHSFTGIEYDTILHHMLPALNTVAVYSLNKDLKGVIEEHFDDTRHYPLCTPVWKCLQAKNHVGHAKKLFAYAHHGSLELFAFAPNRFRFCNHFSAVHANDAVYYILHVWQQLGMKAETDELHVIGNLPEEKSATEQLERFIARVVRNSAAGLLQEAPVSRLKAMPFDLMAYHSNGI
ncbi:MAG: DUF3822 family protein [Prevotella sp.]|nr:DUF3822 family protein [Prevotella sp.]